MKDSENRKKKAGSENAETPAEGVTTDTGRRYGRRAADPGAEESAPIWLVTFADAMALMLTFFVMLFAMAEPEQQHWEDISAALNSEFNKFYGKLMQRGPSDAVNLNRIDFDQALDINYLGALLESMLEENDQLADVRLIPQPGQLILSMPQDLLFSPGEAEIKSEGSRAIYALGGTLSRIRNKVEVIGHADPRPVEQGEFSSNWDLSLARAANVAALLNSVGYERDIDIRGLSSGRYDDLATVIPDQEARMDLARRVDVVIMDHDGRRKQQFFDIELP